MMGTAIFGAIMTNGFKPEFTRLAAPAIDQITRTVQGLPPQVLAQLPPQAQAGLRNPAAMFDNPQILLSPEAMSQLKGSFARFPGGDQILGQLLQAVRSALAGSLHNVFLMGSIVLLGGFVVSLFLGERPLRKSNLEGIPGHGATPTPAPGAEGANGSDGAWSARQGAEAAASPSDTAGMASETEEAREAVPVPGD
jgi:hypothetical protein